MFSNGIYLSDECAVLAYNIKEVKNKMEGNEEETLELVFGTENLLESAKEPFIGEVSYAVFPCHCVDCEKGAGSLQEQYGKVAPERLHIHIKPLTVYTELQHNWWIPTKTKLSRWGALQEQLEKLGLMDKFKTDGFNAFHGMIAEWHWAEVAVGVTGDAKFHWIPVRILTEEEVAAAKASQPSEPSTGTGDAPSGEESTDDAPPSEPGTGTEATKLD